MKILKISWGGRVMDVTYNGEKTGTKFVCNEAKVNDYSREPITEITEDSLTVYTIHYKDGRKLRVFNPIEVLFI